MYSSVPSDRRPFVAIVPWDKGFTAWDPLEGSSGAPWHPQGARTLRLAQAAPEDLAGNLVAGLRAQAFSALLLIGRTRHPGPLRLQIRAENRALESRDRHNQTAAGLYRATLPIAEVLRDLANAGFDARGDSEAEDDVGSYLLYRALADIPDDRLAPAIGLLRLPRDLPREKVNEAIKATATAVARHLPALTVTA